MKNVSHLRVITLRNARKFGAGAYGTYFQLTKRRGVKVFRRDGELTDEGNVNQWIYDDAVREFECQRVAWSHGLAMRPHELVVVETRTLDWQRKRSRYLALVMKHASGLELFEAHGDPGVNGYDECSALEDALANIGVDHGDLHMHNAKRHKGRWIALDFGRASYSDRHYSRNSEARTY